MKARPWFVQLPPFRQGLVWQLSMLISQRSPAYPGGHRQEDSAAEPSVSVHVPPF